MMPDDPIVNDHMEIFCEVDRKYKQDIFGQWF